MGGLSALASLTDTAITGNYYRKVLYYRPIAYWPMWETAGASARCLVNPAQNGTYTGVTLANAAGPDGNPCPFFDGANDCVTIMTAALATVYDNDEGSFMVWARVNSVADWTDGAYHTFIRCTQVGTAYQRIIKVNTNNEINWTRYENPGAQTNQTGGHNNTSWISVAMTWSLSADETKAWKNGSQTGITRNGLAAAAGALSAAWIGANTAVPSEVWHGWLAHAAIWNYALTPAQIADLATV